MLEAVAALVTMVIREMVVLVAVAVAALGIQLFQQVVLELIMGCQVVQVLINLVEMRALTPVVVVVVALIIPTIKAVMVDLVLSSLNI